MAYITGTRQRITLCQKEVLSVAVSNTITVNVAYLVTKSDPTIVKEFKKIFLFLSISNSDDFLNTFLKDYLFSFTTLSGRKKVTDDYHIGLFFLYLGTIKSFLTIRIIMCYFITKIV